MTGQPPSSLSEVNVLLLGCDSLASLDLILDSKNPKFMVCQPVQTSVRQLFPDCCT